MTPRQPAGSDDRSLQQLLDGLKAVRDGDFSTRLPQAGDALLDEIAVVFNGMVDQLSLFTSEVTRVAREVGTEGKLGGQASVPAVSGTWKDLTESVNAMAGNLTAQVRDIASVATAVATGDLTQKITVDVKGELLELKNTINTMVDQLSSFADEVTRVAREVGSEGRLGGQAEVPGVGGTWRDLTTSVNFMAGNLTAQVRSIAEVTTAVAKGDLTQKITVDARGEILELKSTINTMVDTLSSFADEVTRVAKEVGTEGILGGQAQVPGVAGTWRDLTTSVNFMAGNLTAQVRSIAEVTTAVARGDLSQKIRVDARGEILELKDTINTMVGQLSAFADEVTRVAREVGTEGRLGGQADVKGVSGTWKGLTESVNVMADNLTDQVRSIASVATAVARGDLSQKITVEAKGEVAALAGTINTMVDTLSAFADEVTRVAREVGTEGILGGQARVPNVAGTWKSLTDNVNSMANNLTNQVRSIAQVTTAVARGELNQKIDVDARGEILELKTTINTMVDTLSSFAAEVTRVAREVGKEGRLGGQAEVEGVSGTWKRLTENVNELAGNLTRQVRAIAEVASAVATGDLTRSISVEAKGEVAELSDNINAMVQSLRETTRANEDQDWLNKNLARISGLLQGHRDLRTVAQLIMNELTPLVGAQHATFFLMDSGEPVLKLIAGYGHAGTGEVTFDLGQSLIGQVAQTKIPIVVDQTPPAYVNISSSLGQAPPVNLIVLPIVFEDQVLGVIELASFTRFTPVQRDFLEQLMESIGVNVNTIIANGRTDSLLEESQRLAGELQTRSGELQAQQVKLQQSNAELEEKAELLVRQNRDIEIKNFEIEQARQEIEERAQQLALASKYKSEFLANMSHELRTPLTSLLILAGVLAQNSTQNLTAKQVEFAKVIESAGTDLLQLINDILDLSKVEAGKMDIHVEPVQLHQLLEYVQTTFRPLTAEKGLDFDVTVAPDVPGELSTDEQRLRQVLRNLLSNAMKFTENGGVELRVRVVEEGERCVEFAVLDTGIGIAQENLETIFGAFQQADGTTSRRYGGTGLGLSISRQVANLLGGQLRADSQLGKGSTFTLTVPIAPALPAGVGESRPRPVADAQRRVLVLEGPDNHLLTLLVREFVADFTDNGEPVQIESVTTPDEAVQALAAHEHRCVVLDASLPGASALTFLQRLGDDHPLPVLAHPTRKLIPAQERLMRARARTHAVELLPSLDELRERFLVLLGESHGPQPVWAEPQTSEVVPANAESGGPPGLAGRKVLLVDDDARNVLAIEGILELHGMVVRHAPNGRKGIDELMASPDVDLILMDVMMPEMDGYATTAAIRQMPRFDRLPIIMVTAKAMAGDREKSLASGASDYVTKPVVPEELLGCIGRWLAA
ncbi:HAMP domain-containing protein [Amycolatopsis pithecellobii]|uniref:Circadian input-output histidine kinase CikA n=1 Tax=Amycolatopsis pithecellobii TaxID=664692 RepID=A0A6N7ZBM0_9PSEU|nr:HAMP domain-containing protein [Amycolatopsis pithecellobii]MTD59099.1 HAMP domain-containing protein [Amycolatopsis pithecellobii]